MFFRIFVLSALATAFSWTQQLTPAAGQSAIVPATNPADIAPDTVVAVVNGQKFTADHVRKLVAVTPPQVQAAFKADPKQFMRDHAYYLFLEDYAAKNKVDQQSPTKESLEFARLIIMSQAGLNHALRQTDVTPEEQRKYYAAHSSEYKESSVRMIYVPFTDPANENEAKTKAEAIARRAKAGEDFAKLTKETSGDAGSADSSFTVRMNSSQPPEQMRRTILALKKGEVTNALRHENGYYVFRVESSDVLPYEKVQNEIYREIQDSKFRDWEKKTRSQATVQFENEAFFQNIGKEK